MLVIAVMATCASLAGVAYAGGGSGDFVGCQNYYLPYQGACPGPDYHVWVQTEGWNSDGNGAASCSGVLHEQGQDWPIVGEKCDSNGGTYDAEYCTSACDGQTGHGFVEDNAGYNEYYTGWGQYSS
jgi:hypothetical protein